MPRIFVAGDVHNSGNSTGELCTPAVAEIIADADYSVCNFEGPVAGAGHPQPKSGKHLAQQLLTLDGLHSNGFDLVLLANNHIMDFGVDGLNATLHRANEVGLDTLGAGHDAGSSYAPIVKDLDGIRIGLINGCEAQFGMGDDFRHTDRAGYAWINSDVIDRTVLDLKDSCDAVIVFAHAGLEDYSIPQKEWRQRYRYLCRLGADAVVGSHPHVPQGYEYSEGGLIVYSLGNFYFDSGRYREADNNTYSIVLEVGPNGGVSLEPVYHLCREGRVTLVSGSRCVDLADLNGRLGDGYWLEHDQMSLEVYSKVRENLCLSLNKIPFEYGLRGLLRWGGRSLQGRLSRLDKHILQLHMVRNETYHYAARQALEIMVADELSARRSE